MNKDIAKRLVQLRKQKGLSQEALAEKLNLSRQAISKWERGESSPDIENIIQLAKFYEVSFDELLSSDEYSVSNEDSKEVEVRYVEVIRDDNYINWWSIVAVIILFIFAPLSWLPAAIGYNQAECHNNKGKVLAVISLIISICSFLLFLFGSIL